MYKGIAASRGIGIGSVCVIVEHDLKFEAKKVENIDTFDYEERYRNLPYIGILKPEVYS